jgi:hypothetical protein
VLNHVLRDMVDILAVAKSNCVVVSEEGMQSMDPKATSVYIDAVKQVMSIYKQLEHKQLEHKQLEHTGRKS